MNMQVRYLDGVQFVAETRGHRLVSDQPLENGGKDRGMTPPEFLLASLGTCAAYYALQYLKTRKLPADGLMVNVTAEKAAQPARLGSFRIEVSVADLPESHLNGIERAVHACLIHNTLLHQPVIEVSVERVRAPLAA